MAREVNRAIRQADAIVPRPRWGSATDMGRPQSLVHIACHGLGLEAGALRCMLKNRERRVLHLLIVE